MSEDFFDRRQMEIQGRYNLEMGIHLAAKDLFNKYENFTDDSIPPIPREKVEKLFSALHAEYNRLQMKSRRKKRLHQIMLFLPAASVLLMALTAAAFAISAAKGKRRHEV